MKKYIVILAALALAIGGSINLTGCGKPAAAPNAAPDPIPAPGYTGPVSPPEGDMPDPKAAENVGTKSEDDPKPAEK